MHQLLLPGLSPLPAQKIVNVAAVKHRSPFRYPGGKTWLVPRVFRWLESLASPPTIFIEPFAGGAIVGLSVAFERLADHVLLIELDAQVAAVWEVLINRGEGPWLAGQIRHLELTAEAVDRLLNQPHLPVREQALQTIVRNRIQHGGILAEGAGKLRYGENGKGILSRWYPATLQKRILAIDAIRDRLSFIQGDGIEIIRRYADRQDVVFFIDPPYTASNKKPGSRLYNHWQLDHEELFSLVKQIKGDFLMTYDNVPEVRQMASRYGLDSEAVPMKNTHHARLTELLIGKNLDWARR